MAAANVNVQVIPIGIGGNTDGYKSGWIVGATKVARYDTLTVTNVKTVFAAVLSDDAGGTVENITLADNVITLNTNATSKTLSGVILYKEF